MSEAELAELARRAFRLGALFAEELLLPASTLYESAIARRTVGAHPELVEDGTVLVAAGDETLEAHQDAKSKMYDASSPADLTSAYQCRPTGLLWPTYRQRVGSSTTALIGGWNALASDDARKYLDPDEQYQLPPEVQNGWLKVPDRLHGRAFTPDHILQVFHELPVAPFARRIGYFVEESYTVNYASTLDASLLVDVPHLVGPAIENAQSLSYRTLVQKLRSYGLIALLDTYPSQAFAALRVCTEWLLMREVLVQVARQPYDMTCQVAEDVSRVAQSILQSLQRRRILTGPAAHASSASAQVTGAQMGDPIRVFVSHASIDRELTERLVELLEACLAIPDNSIRCTSVPGYMLAVGEVAADKLREEIGQCDVLIAVITPGAISSGFVLMELGAAWAFKRKTCPIIARGMSWDSLPGPLRPTHSARMDDTTSVSDFVTAISEATNFQPRNQTRCIAAINRFVAAL